MDKAIVIEELRRVAATLNRRTLSRSTFEEHGRISSGAVADTFGSWTEAITAAGLLPLPQGGIRKDEQRRLDRLSSPPAVAPDTGRIPDDDLLDELMRLAKALGRRPSGHQIAAKGKYHPDVYKRRFGSVAAAYEAAQKRGR